MFIRKFSLGVLLVCVGSAVCQATTYRLSGSSLFDSKPYGFTGLITTDGTTGLLTDADFIVAWSINVLTPSTTDGVSSELLTQANSSVSLFLDNTAGLRVTPISISMPPTHGPPLAMLSFSTPNDDTRLTYTNRFTDGQGIGAGVAIFDQSEDNPALGFVLPGLPIAVVVPEPSPLLLIMGFALGALIIYRNRHFHRDDRSAPNQVPRTFLSRPADFSS